MNIQSEVKVHMIRTIPPQYTIKPWRPKSKSSPADPKMAELCNHTAQASLHRACAKDGHLKCPNLPNIDGDIWWDLWLVFCYFWVGRHLTRN